MELWALSMAKHDDLGLFELYEHMYAAIDATRHGNAPWQCFSTSYDAPSALNVPSWRFAEYEVWYCDPAVVICNMLDNHDFQWQFNYEPHVELGKDGQRQWSDFMSGNFAWRHSVSV